MHLMRVVEAVTERTDQATPWKQAYSLVSWELELGNLWKLKPLTLSLQSYMIFASLGWLLEPLISPCLSFSFLDNCVG